MDKRKAIREMLEAELRPGELAERLGISRVRVYELVRSMGLPPPSLIRANRVARRQEAEYFERWGCSKEERKQISSVAGRAYSVQRRNAMLRGIGWEFTLGSWYRLWQESGKWHLRGKRVGQYVMARFNDEGPYAPNNVYFTTCSQNHADYVKGKAQKDAESRTTGLAGVGRVRQTAR